MIALFGLLSTAYAGGYYYPDAGIIANGRGCAFTAGAYDQFAQYYNPAGLIRSTRPTVNIGYSGVKQAVTFARQVDPPPEVVDGQLVDPDPYLLDPVKNEGGRFGVPELGFVTPIVADKVAFGFGFTSGFAPDYKFSGDGPQRYTIVDNLVWNFNIGPSVAVRPVPWLSLGLGLQWQFLRVEEQLKVTTSGADDPAGDVLVTASVFDKFTPGFNAGVIVEPVPDVVAIGVSVQPPSKFRARGPGTLDFSTWGGAEFLDQEVWEDDDVALSLDIPLFLRTGVSVHPIPELELEADFDYETWSSLSDIVVSDIDVTVTGTACGTEGCAVEDQISLPAGFVDTWSVRVGGEYDATDWLTLRAGGFYESSSLPIEQVSVSLVDTSKFMEGGGFSVYLLKDRNLAIDAYASVIEYKDLDITTSEVTQVNVYGGPEAVVGNGQMSSFGSSIGAAARWRFGRDPELGVP